MKTFLFVLIFLFSGITITKAQDVVFSDAHSIAYEIKKGDNLVMIVKGHKIVLEKSDNIALLLDGEFRDVKTLTDATLKKIWLNKHDEKWNKYAKRIAK